MFNELTKLLFIISFIYIYFFIVFIEANPDKRWKWHRTG